MANWIGAWEGNLQVGEAIVAGRVLTIAAGKGVYVDDKTKPPMWVTTESGVADSYPDVLGVPGKVVQIEAGTGGFTQDQLVGVTTDGKAIDVPNDTTFDNGWVLGYAKETTAAGELGKVYFMPMYVADASTVLNA